MRHLAGIRLLHLATSASLLVGCDDASSVEAPLTYVCGTTAPEPGAAACGAGDPKLPPEPTLPTEDQVCQTLTATKPGPDENDLDTVRVQAALTACTGRAVRLVVDPATPANNSFVVGHLNVNSVTLWVDAGVTLYASRNAELFQKTGNCGKIGINDSGACTDFITVSGTRPAIVGDGTIDGQGGEPILAGTPLEQRDYSWWELSGALREIDGSMGNPTLINLASGTKGFVLYRVTLHNSAKFHVKITSNPVDGTCDTPGEGFVVWGITLLTPSRLYNSIGRQMSPAYARNTDGVDPGTTADTSCGVIACSTISTGDDNIAIKGGHRVSDLIIAHNHFGTGHGMSIGSETYGGDTGQPSVERVEIYDLSIDADSRWVGPDARSADFNGIRIKSDISRGGIVDNITYRDVCMRDMTNAILINTAYNPLFSGSEYPQFRRITFENVRHVTCMGLQQPTVDIEGFSAALPAGPITLNNVVIDNIGPAAVASEYVDVRRGPGPVNFTPTGPGVTVTDSFSNGIPPFDCSKRFPPLPAPELPAGWLHGAPR